MQIVHRNESQHRKFDVVEQACKSLLHTAYLIRKQKEQVLAHFQLSIPKLEVMQIVNSVYPDAFSQKEIRERISDKTIDLPRLIQQMDREGIIKQERSVLNKRVSEIMITPKGLELLEKVELYLQEARPQIIPISDEEAVQMFQTTQKIALTFRKAHS